MTNTTEKMTNVRALTYVVENCEMPADVKEKVENVLASYVKKSEYKSHTERKPSEAQKQYPTFYEAVREYLTEHGASTLSDMVKNIPALSENAVSTQRLMAILKPYRDSGEIVRTEVKRIAYYAIVG